MAKKKKAKDTEILVVLDRSGSMGAVRRDTIDGFNTFLADQKAAKGECWLTLLQFDTELEVIHNGVPVADVPKLTEATFVPRGFTALLDAIAHGIGLLEARVAKNKRLAHVTILTDGEENASREVSRERVFELIEARKKDGWAVQYIGAGQDAIRVGQSLGVPAAMSANYAGTGASTKAAFSSVSRAARSYRSSGAVLDAAFTSAERSAMVDDDENSATP